jgi:mono/diheme cytochrome c family protein
VTADVITVLAVVAGIIWLGVLLVSALRNRGGEEEVAPNLKPGIDDQQLETKRLENGQKAAIAFSAFLAISLPLYFLGEGNRQEGFVEEFDEASAERGAHLVEEFGCYTCHGPLGAGGAAPFVEPRSGVTVSWAAPSINDVFYRYNEDEVTYWLVYGRANTPMPAWGLDGGGPMNDKQIEDLVNYLQTIQIPQQQVVDQTVGKIEEQLLRLDTADAAVAATIVEQEQTVAEIDQAVEDLAYIGPLDQEAEEILDGAAEGIDTDGDGLSDSAEVRLSEISVEAVTHFQAMEPIVLDPEQPDAELVDESLAELQAGAERDPILRTYVEDIETALAEDEVREENPDTDGDGISDAAEGAISGLFAEAAAATVPSSVTVVSLDPTNPESVSGVPDQTTASNMVGGLDTIAINLRVTVENRARIEPAQLSGLEFLVEAAQAEAWEIDIPGVAEAMEASEEEAARAAGLFNAYCARCHTASFSAGVPFTLEAGSGGFGPALWDGRPTVQFGDAPTSEEAPDLLADFLVNGSVNGEAYGLNGMGSGRMPAFGTVLDPADIELLARYLRSGNLDGRGE